MHSTRFLVLAGLIAGLAFSFINCGPATCDAKSCATGCCDAKKACQTGTANTACGKAGATCAACPTGQLCAQQVCTATTGGGAGGGTGGGTGGGAAGGTAGGTAGGAAGGTAGGSGGGTAGCVTYPAIPVSQTLSGRLFTTSSGNYRYWSGLMITNRDAGTFDAVFAERWFAAASTPPTFPADFTLGVSANDQTYGNCDNCIYMYWHCTNSNCSNTDQKLLYANSGTVHWASATGDGDAGSFAGTAANLRFVEWSYNSSANPVVDVAVAGGLCVEIPSMEWNTCWPVVDGGC